MPYRFEPFRKLQQSPVPPGLSQQFVGVGAGGAADTLFTLNQIAEVIGGLTSLQPGVTPITGGAANKFLYDNGGTLEEGTFGSGLTFSGGVLTAEGSGGRTLLTANTSYYVATTGNDSNPGTITQPWLTLQHALFFIAASLDIAGFIVTINVGAGTFAGAGPASTVGGGAIQINGAGSASTTLTDGPNDGVYNDGSVFSIIISSETLFGVNKVTVKSPTGGNFYFEVIGFSGLIIGDAPTLQSGDVVWDSSTASSDGQVGIFGTLGSINTAVGTYVIKGTNWNSAAVIGQTVWGFATMQFGNFTPRGSWTIQNSPTMNFCGGEQNSWINLGLVGVTGTFTGFYAQAYLNSVVREANSLTGNPVFADSSSALSFVADGGIIGFPGTNLTYPQSTTALRTVLAADTTFHVSSTGSDSNDGSAGAPWLTLTHAMSFIASKLDIASFNVNVFIGAGTFVGFGVQTTVGGGTINFTGAGSTSTFIDNGPNDGVINFGDPFDVIVPMPSAVNFSGVRFAPSTPPGDGAISSIFFPITLGLLSDITVDLTHMANGDVVWWFDANAVTVFSNAPITYIGGPASLASIYLIESNAVIFIQGSGISTVTGSQIVTTGFMWCDTGGLVTISGGQTFSGAGVTGPRFFIGTAGRVEGASGAGSLGLNFFPGTTQGSCDSSSSYDGFPGTDLTYPQPTTILRTVLTAKTEFYVAATGNDSNPGSLTSPWLTLQHATNFIANNIDCGGFLARINVGAGTFAGVGLKPFLNGFFEIKGAGVASTFIGNGPNDHVFNFGECISVYPATACQFWINQLTLKPTAKVGGMLYINTGYNSFIIGEDQDGAGASGALNFDDSNATGTPCIATFGPNSQIQDSFSAVNLFTVVDATGGFINSGAIESRFFLIGQYTVTGTPVLNQAWITLFDDSVLTDYGTTWTGSATGQRFIVDTGSRLEGNSVGVLGPNYYPGSTAGICTTGSSYDGFLGAGPTGFPQTTTTYRTILAADTTFHVAATGSDSNDGSAGSPWATPQHAADMFKDVFDTGGLNHVVSIGPGTFTGVYCTGGIGSGSVFFQGAGSASTVLTTQTIGPNGGSVEINLAGYYVAVDGLELRATAGNGYWFCFDAGGMPAQLGNISFGSADLLMTAAAAGPPANGIAVNAPGLVFVGIGTFTVSNAGGGTINSVMIPTLQGQIQDYGSWVISGTPAWGTAFIHATGGGLYVNGDVGGAPTGAATGTRFKVDGGSNISPGFGGTGNLGPNFFPGSVAGTVDASSFYDGFPGPLPGINTQVTGYTFAIADAFARVEYNGTGAAVFTVPGNGTVGFEIGTKITMTQIGTGNLSGSAGGGVTVHNVGAVGGQWRSALLYKRGTDEWVQTNV